MNIKLLFDKNKSKITSLRKIGRQFKLMTNGQKRCWLYTNNNPNFSGTNIKSLIHFFNYINENDKFYLPIIIQLGKVNFEDKLVYIVLECILYYMILKNRRIIINFTPETNISTDGISFSPINCINKSYINIKDYIKFEEKFYHDSQEHHYRELIEYNEIKTYYLTEISNELYTFFSKLGIETDTIEKLCESIIEIVGNSIEHGRSDCLIDIDVTEEKYKKKNDTEDSFYYGINVVVLGISDIPFNKKIKTKLLNIDSLNERYVKVKEAKQNHSKYFCSDYSEDDFYTIASFQHKISGSIDKKNSGGVGLTQLIKSLEEKSSGHLCYMLSGNRALKFQKEFLQYDSECYIGFNKENDFYEHIPDRTVFANSDTFFPGTAYNLNFAIKKGDLHYGK